ncbi:GNAT family N-acetyltransferase [Arenibaculum pallidiluteum]|uniref:GNAT family N-acetyltransferase n=1 Tax=Arenibaculum pallidiluteum TaxID=2812559 RepID=UPI001F371D87
MTGSGTSFPTSRPIPARGEGIGWRPVAAGEAWLRRQGMRKAQLLVRSTSSAMIGLYERLGYRAVPSTLIQHWINPPDET